jgi:hypothetical protein
MTQEHIGKANIEDKTKDHQDADGSSIQFEMVRQGLQNAAPH